MKKKCLLVLLIWVSICSCRKYNEEQTAAVNIPKKEYQINLNISDGGPKFKGTASKEPMVAITARFKDVISGRIYKIKGDGAHVRASLPERKYEVQVVAYIKHKQANKNIYRPYSAKAVLSSNDLISTMSLNLANPFIDFKIEEIFYAGTSGGTRDQYVKITNTADVSLIADGLVIMEAAFVNTSWTYYMPDVSQTDFPVHAIYKIPENMFSEVAPGESIIIADQASNHLISNLNSRDLSTVDLEWCDAGGFDTDNTSVPNMERIYSNIPNSWMLNNRGLRSFAIGYMGVSVSTYLASYTYQPTYTEINGQTKTYHQIYKFPIDWIADGINLSPAQSWTGSWLASSIDAGYTGIGSIKGDSNRFDKAIVRKRDGQGELVDTDNSSYDFNHEGSAPSVF